MPFVDCNPNSNIFNFISSFFFRIPDGLTAEDRILSVLEFYLTSFHAGRKVRYPTSYRIFLSPFLRLSSFL